MVIAKSLFYFVLAGLCEISGGYLVWLWLRENKSLWLALVGAIVLIIICTQTISWAGDICNNIQISST